MSLVQRFWKWLQVWYGLKDLPDLKDVPPSGHGEWVRYPEQIQPNVQVPTVQVKPVLVSAREVAHFQRMRVELLQDGSQVQAGFPTTGPISQIPTQPVERDTDVTLEVPALTNKLIHGRHKKS